MINLDERLREIMDKFEPLRYTTDGGETFQDELSVDEAITQMKQAFADEGYVKSDIQGAIKEYMDAAIEDAKVRIERKKVLGDVMTGQEWYDRFEKELYIPRKQEYGFKSEEDRARFYRDGGTNFMYQQALNTAKQASNIKESD